MKKLNFLIVAFLAVFNLNAQELIPNGGFETWNWTGSNYLPNGWGFSIPANGGGIEQSYVRHTGEWGIRMQAPDGSGNARIYLENDLNVLPGQSYILKYWYDDSSDNVKFRHWASFVDVNGVQINHALDLLQPDFLSNSVDGWQEVIIAVTAPANASKFRLDFRTYQDESSQSGYVYLDDVSFKGSNMSVSELQNAKVSMTSVWNNTANFNVKENAIVEIFNLNGQLVQKGNGSNNFELNVASLAKGVCVVKVTVDGVATTQKVVKK